MLGKDENTLNLLNKYNLTITYIEELYNRIIEEGGGQEINGKFIPILAMTDLKTLTYLIENLRAKDLSSRDDNITKIVGKVVMHYHYGDDL